MITVTYMRTTEIEDVFFVAGKGNYYYVRYPKGTMTENDVLNEILYTASV